MRFGQVSQAGGPDELAAAPAATSHATIVTIIVVRM